MKTYFMLTLFLFLNLNSHAISFPNQAAVTKQQTNAQTLFIDTSMQQSIEQIMGLAPDLKVSKCDVVISSHGTIYKLEYGKPSQAESFKKLWERLKNTQHKDILFIDNIWVIKDGKLMKLTGQKAFTIQ